MTPDHEGMILSTTIYSMKAILEASYKFTDRCFVSIRPKESHKVVVEFRPKTTPARLAEIMGEFSNELIDQQLREMIAQETKDFRRTILARAFSDGPDAPG